MSTKRSQSTPAPPLSRRRTNALAASLVRWYDTAARDLPWRHTRDPYAIWVSEIMLQQTRVEAVIDRYRRFLRRFPSIEALAAADGSEVLAEWAGLGYYRRARSLHAAARQLAHEGDGELPRTAAALRLLPGFGPYTAGAVASIAFDEPVAAVDGNVERVIARLLALPDDPAKGDSARAVRAVAQQMVEAAPPNRLTQALMELGALVCTPRAPACSRCPWRRGCAARATGAPEQFPRKLPKAPPVVVSSYAAVHRHGDQYLWRRRPDGGRNAGLWELPTTEWHGGPPEPDRAREMLEELGESLGQAWVVGEPVTQVRHSITNHRVTVVGYRVEGTGSAHEAVRWAPRASAAELGLTAAAAKLLKRLPTLL